MTDTEANTPLRTSADATTRTAQSEIANKFKALCRVIFVLAAVFLVLLNLWSSISKGGHIGESSAVALVEIAKAAASAAIEDAETQWKNKTVIP
jgi:hypothetical protein